MEPQEASSSQQFAPQSEESPLQQFAPERQEAVSPQLFAPSMEQPEESPLPQFAPGKPEAVPLQPFALPIEQPEASPLQQFSPATEKQEAVSLQQFAPAIKHSVLYQPKPSPELLEQDNMEEAGMILCGEALELPCPMCLSLGRAMSPLREPARAYCMLLAGLRQEDAEDLVTYTLVCWECAGFVDRMLRFQEQVLHANILVRSYAADENERQKTFSTLTSVMKIGFDELLLHRDSWERRGSRAPPAERAPEGPGSAEGERPEGEGEGRPRRKRRPKLRDLPDPPARKSERKYKPLVLSEQTVEIEFDVPIKVEKKGGREPRQTRRKTIVKAIGSWPGKKVLLKGRKKNVKIVSMSMTESEMLRFREEDLASDAYLSAPFRCATCIKGFTFVNLLERHNALRHSEEAGAHLCEVCAVRLPSEEQLQRHRKKHRNLYVCSACGYSHRMLPDVFRHYNAVHETGKTFPCTVCDEVFVSSRKMRYHREITHKDTFKCEHCGKVMRNQQSFKAHLLIHTGMPSLECTLCRKSCRGETGLYAHMRTAHAQQRAEEAYCAECGVQFKNKAIYRSHLRTSVKHATPAQLKYICDKCDKKFISETALKQHHRYYHMEYHCSVCGKRLNNWYSLDKHVKFVHEGRELPRKHVCETCGKAFKTKRALGSHQLTHTGERPFSCNVCGATFAQKSTLKTHQRLVHFKGKTPAPAATVEPLPA